VHVLRGTHEVLALTVVTSRNTLVGAFKSMRHIPTAFAFLTSWKRAFTCLPSSTLASSSHWTQALDPRLPAHCCLYVHLPREITEYCPTSSVSLITTTQQSVDHYVRYDLSVYLSKRYLIIVFVSVTNTQSTYGKHRHTPTPQSPSHESHSGDTKKTIIYL
jgi:hypothetical protein